MDTLETAVLEPSLPPPTSKPSAAKVVIVDIGERQSVEDVKSLRSGQGKLIDHVERIMADLVSAGAVGSHAQPVVFVVRESSTPAVDDDEDDD